MAHSRKLSKKAVTDRLFAKKKAVTEDFHFGKETAAVFDDMLERSVPFYAEVQRMMSELAGDFAVEGSNLYDLGCSTCTTFLALDKLVAPGVRFVGLDSSQEMLNRAKAKLKQTKVRHEFELVRADLNQPISISDASVVIMNLTLQFIRPLYRHQLMKNIVSGMRPGGALILVEKVLCRDSTLNRCFIKYYYDFKQRNGYSRTEIAKKREALENVLIPYRIEENMELLLSSGFSQCDVFFKWYNFSGIVALK